MQNYASGFLSHDIAYDGQGRWIAWLEERPKRPRNIFMIVRQAVPKGDVWLENHPKSITRLNSCTPVKGRFQGRLRCKKPQCTPRDSARLFSKRGLQPASRLRGKAIFQHDSWLCLLVIRCDQRRLEYRAFTKMCWPALARENKLQTKDNKNVVKPFFVWTCFYKQSGDFGNGFDNVRSLSWFIRFETLHDAACSFPQPLPGMSRQGSSPVFHQEFDLARNQTIQLKN